MTALTRAVRNAVAVTLGIAPARIRDDSDFGDDLHADSLDRARIICAIEEATGVRLTDDEADFARTVGTAADLIEARQANGDQYDRRTQR